MVRRRRVQQSSVVLKRLHGQIDDYSRRQRPVTALGDERPRAIQLDHESGSTLAAGRACLRSHTPPSVHQHSEKVRPTNRRGIVHKCRIVQRRTTRRAVRELCTAESQEPGHRSRRSLRNLPEVSCAVLQLGGVASPQNSINCARSFRFVLILCSERFLLSIG